MSVTAEQAIQTIDFFYDSLLLAIELFEIRVGLIDAPSEVLIIAFADFRSCALFTFGKTTTCAACSCVPITSGNCLMTAPVKRGSTSNYQCMTGRLKGP